MNETRKPIGESGFGANDGVSVATHHVTVWLENSRRFRNQAELEMERGYPLSVIVGSLLYDPNTISTWGPDEQHELKNVRESITGEDFDGIDWDFVKESLRAE